MPRVARNVTVDQINSNEQALISESSPVKTVSLADLLKNPNLIRPSGCIKRTESHLSPHEETLLEEENTSTIQGNTKRSRAELNVASLSTDSSFVRPTPSLTALQHKKSNTQSTPMEVVQAKPSSSSGPFLSAAPGSQACWES